MFSEDRPLYTDADFENARMFQYEITVWQKVQPFGHYVVVEECGIVESYSDIAVKVRKAHGAEMEEYYPRKDCRFIVSRS